jgi:hypothetical protein
MDTAFAVGTKQSMIDSLTTMFENRNFQPLVAKKAVSASETDLITIGKNMKSKLQSMPSIQDITHVLIENQISTIATRMKTIQGMLAQFFIMSYPTIHIEFVSSVNKLKFIKSLPDQVQSPVSAPAQNKYSTRKKDGVLYCSQFIDANAWLQPWIPTFQSKKRDDLADCFLQALWFLLVSSQSHV